MLEFLHTGMFLKLKILGVGMGKEVGGRFKREGTHVYLWLIHVEIWQEPIQYCKAIIL